MSNAAYARTVGVLAYRDLRFIFWGLPGRLIDTAIVACMQLLAISQFLPLLGMPTNAIAALFAGTMTQIVFSSAYGIAFTYVTDLHRNRFINYQLTLPMPKTFLFGEFIFIFMIEIFFISLPLIIAGSLFLGPLFPLHHANWFLIIAMYLFSLLFFSLLFIYLAFNAEYTWFLDNVWARRLTPLFLLGCSFFTWKKLYAFNKTLGTLFLCNPLTYIHEGLRGAFLGQENFLPFWICFGMTVISCTLLVLLLSYAIKKRLDPV